MRKGKNFRCRKCGKVCYSRYPKHGKVLSNKEVKELRSFGLCKTCFLSIYYSVGSSRGYGVGFFDAVKKRIIEEVGDWQRGAGW